MQILSVLACDNDNDLSGNRMINRNEVKNMDMNEDKVVITEMGIIGDTENKNLCKKEKHQKEFICLIAIKYYSFDISKITFKRPILNRYFSGLFSQIKYQYEIFTIFNPLFIPDKNNFLESITEIEKTILEKYDVDKKKKYFLNHYLNRKDFLGSKNMMIKFSGVWENKSSIGIIAKIIYMA